MHHLVDILKETKTHVQEYRIITWCWAMKPDEICLRHIVVVIVRVKLLILLEFFFMQWSRLEIFSIHPLWFYAFVQCNSNTTFVASYHHNSLILHANWMVIFLGLGWWWSGCQCTICRRWPWELCCWWKLWSRGSSSWADWWRTGTQQLRTNSDWSFEIWWQCWDWGWLGEWKTIKTSSWQT